METLWMLVKPWWTLAIALCLAQWQPLTLLLTTPLHFVTVVSTLHDAVHGTLGVPRRWQNLVLCVYGALMLQSGHSFRRTHLYHHRHFPDPCDLEGHPAHGDVLGALKAGPLYLGRLWWWSWVRHRSDRPWLFGEAVHRIGWLAAALLVWHDGVWLVPPVFAVAAWGLPLVTAKLQHDPAGTTAEARTRSIRHPLAAWLLQGLGYHREHHRYPHVPSMKLRGLCGVGGTTP